MSVEMDVSGLMQKPDALGYQNLLDRAQELLAPDIVLQQQGRTVTTEKIDIKWLLAISSTEGTVSKNVQVPTKPAELKKVQSISLPK